MNARRRRICLVTPGHLSTNPRLVKEADAFCEAGYDVRVVAGRFLAWADDADEEFASRPWRFERIAFGPLAGRRAHVRQSAIRRSLDALSRAVPLPARADERAFHPIVAELRIAAMREPADLYVAHNLAALPAAAGAAKRHASKLGFDAEDFHDGELPAGPATEAPRRRIRRIQERYLPACDYVSAASPLIARAYAESYGIREPLPVLNVFPLSERPAAAAAPDAPGRPALYWFSQTIGPDRGLENAVAAVGLATSRPHFYLRGRPLSGFVERLREIAGPEVSARLHVLPPMRPGELVRDASRYDAGLSAESSGTLNRDLCLSNKFFVYLLAGIPAVISDTRAHRAISSTLEGAALLFEQDSAASLAQKFDELVAPRSAAAYRTRAWQLGTERFNWDREKARLLEQIEALWT